VGGGVVAEQAAWTELDRRETSRVEATSTSIAAVDLSLRSEASLALVNRDYPFSEAVRLPIGGTMLEQQDYSQRRVQRAAFETDRLLVVGDVTLPPESYQSRFSDSLNRVEVEFISLTACEVTSLADGQTRHQDFLVLSKRHIRVAYPVDSPGGPGSAPDVGTSF
jgi:hypothetical protein